MWQLTSCDLSRHTSISRRSSPGDGDTDAYVSASRLLEITLAQGFQSCFESKIQRRASTGALLISRLRLPQDDPERAVKPALLLRSSGASRSSRHWLHPWRAQCSRRDTQDARTKRHQSADSHYPRMRVRPYADLAVGSVPRLRLQALSRHSLRGAGSREGDERAS